MSGGSPENRFDPARHLDAMAPALGLHIDEAHRPGVLQFLAIAAKMAEIVAAAPIDEDRLEPAPSFRPGSPGDEP